MASCPVALVATLADDEKVKHCFRGAMPTPWERFEEAQATVMEHSGKALASASTGVGGSWGQQGLDTCLCLSGTASLLAFSNYCGRKMEGFHHTASLSSWSLSL